jgi:hypothetical protein
MANEEKEVSINLDSAGNLSVSKLVLQAGTSDKISFRKTGNVESFAIQFIGISPLTKAYFRSGDSESIQVRSSAEPGSYSYAIAVTDDKFNIYLDATCPGIIIDW